MLWRSVAALNAHTNAVADVPLPSFLSTLVVILWDYHLSLDINCRKNGIINNGPEKAVVGNA